MFRFTFLLICILAPLVISKSIPRPICGPVCDIYCPYGNVLDERGCSTCQCKQSPCQGEQAPLEGYFCGDGPNRQDCPLGYKCIIAYNDLYAVCCPPDEEPVTKPVETTMKPGSCPTPSSKVGSCIATCNTDDDCQGNLKCCGGCPRECVQPSF